MSDLVPNESNEPNDVEVEGEIVEVSASEVELPKEGLADTVKRITKGAAGLVPGGSFAAQFVDAVWKTPYQKNMDAFLLDFARRVVALEGRVDDLGSRLQSPILVSLGIEAARSAGSTASDEKRTYLANALLNVMEDRSWDGESDLADILLRLIGELTMTHIRILELLTDPEAWGRRHGVDFRSQLQATENGRWPIRGLISAAFPELSSATTGAALMDLESRHLLRILYGFDHDASMVDLNELMAGFPSELGLDLLRFIRRE
jgi:hypothetical protein